jgi:predicted KAP-like P-loop ATPase
MTSVEASSSDHLFSSDRPITRLEEDKLDRRAFAEQIARAVRGWKGKDSLVIALYGSWGTGKSSIKNMVVDALRSIPEGASVIDFNPWQVASRAQISESFFDEIGIAIGKGPVASLKASKKVVTKWKKYAVRLKSGSGLISLFVNPIRWTLIISAVLILGSVVPTLRTAGIIVAGLYLLVGLLTWSSKFSEQMAAFHEAGAETQTLEEVKADVRKELTGLSTPILVLIDDLDRLTPAELLEMFQLVKANGDFPNIVYLLLCDRPIVEKHIAEVIKGASGRDYLEKIVQVPFDVPVLDTKRVHEILFSDLNTLLSDAVISKNFNQTRWGNVFFGGLRQYFGTLRQVNRFVSSLSFHMSMFKADDSFEVNAIDLIALEALRVYEPTVYQALPENKRLLTGTSDFGRGRNDEERRKLAALLDNVPPERTEGVRELVKHLFPPAEWAFGGSHYGTDWTDVWYRELRVCSEDVFDRYFHFVLPRGELSQAAIDRLLAASGDRGAFRAELNVLAAKGLLEVAMDRLEAYKQQIPIAHAIPFVTAMFDSTDQLSSERTGMFELSPVMHAERIIFWYLKQEQDPARRGEILRAAIEHTDGLSLPLGFINLIDPNQGDRTSPEEFVPADVLQQLKDACVRKINSFLAAGQIPKDLSGTLYCWRTWAGPDGPTAFCTAMIQTPAGLLQFLRAFVVCARSHALTDYVVTPHWYIRRRDIETFVPFDAVEDKVTALPADTALSPEDDRAVAAFKKAAERRRTGESDENPFAIHRA